jgi:ATP-dependent Lon protease
MKNTMTKMDEKKMKAVEKKQSKKRVVESSDEDDDEDYETVSDSEEEEETGSDEHTEEESDDSVPENKKKLRNYKKKENADDEKLGRSLFKLLKKKAMEIVEKEDNKKNKNRKSVSPGQKNNRIFHTDGKRQRRRRLSDDEDECDDDDEDDEDYEDEENEDDDDEDDDEEDDDEEDEDEDDDGIPVEKLAGQGIILAFDGFGGSARNDETDYKQMIREDKNEKCNSDDEEMFMKESYTHIAIPETPQTSPNTTAKHHEKKRKIAGRKNDDRKKKKMAISEDAVDEPSIDDQYKEFVTLRQDLTEQLAKQPKSKILRNAIKECKTSISELIRKERNKNAHNYYKLVHKDQKDKKNTNEISYFKKNLSHKEQMRVMKDLKEINALTNTDKPYRLSLLESSIPPKFKAIALQKLQVLNSMGPSDSEYYKMKNWVDGFMRVPFGLYKHLNVKLEDGTDACSGFLKNAKNTLDSCTYGLNDAKLQILQMLGQWIANKDALGTAIAIKGPPGTGKTTLVKEGISKILGRDFAFIALGGTSDASFLEGHSYTYEGSSWGKIVSILMESKSMNPVIYFDELDKISDTPKGEEITSILTHLTDTSQNNQFSDKYFSEVHFDLSKCLFIFSYNDESKVNPILKDRMYRIQTNGYESKEKIIIARKHILPKIREQINFKEGDIIIPDETLQYIISQKQFCKEEQGVRNLKRCLEIIHTKLNLFRLVNKEEKLFEKDIAIDVSFPFTVEKKHVDILIKTDDPMNQSLLAMYM